MADVPAKSVQAPYDAGQRLLFASIPCMLQYHRISKCGARVLLISTETAAWKCRRLRQV